MEKTNRAPCALRMRANTPGLPSRGGFLGRTAASEMRLPDQISRSALVDFFEIVKMGAAAAAELRSLTLPHRNDRATSRAYCSGDAPMHRGGTPCWTTPSGKIDAGSANCFARSPCRQERGLHVPASRGRSTKSASKTASLGRTGFSKPAEASTGDVVVWILPSAAWRRSHRRQARNTTNRKPARCALERADRDATARRLRVQFALR